MAMHKYDLGDRVRFTPARLDRSAALAGNYRIMRLMPEEEGDLQYRIKSENDAHERCAGESRLRREQTDADSVFKL
jgi:hypothetical protein